MSEGNFISDVIEYDSFKLGKLNLIIASCGSGKTTAAYTFDDFCYDVRNHRRRSCQDRLIRHRNDPDY